MSAVFDITDEMIRQATALPDPVQAILSLMDRVGMRESHSEIDTAQQDAWAVSGPHARMAILVYWRTLEQLREPELCF